MTPNELIKMRQDTHGNFTDNAFRTIAGTKTIINTNTPYEAQFASFMIIHKLSRINSGDWKYLDHWRDIQGYAQLIINELEHQNGHNV